uniref:Uncharacterized protein n=1 Tax=Oryza nivara TaxID=4536 RepID=A0A0E0IDS5_ORYNI
MDLGGGGREGSEKITATITKAAISTNKVGTDQIHCLARGLLHLPVGRAAVTTIAPAVVVAMSRLYSHPSVADASDLIFVDDDSDNLSHLIELYSPLSSTGGGAFTVFLPSGNVSVSSHSVGNCNFDGQHGGLLMGGLQGIGVTGRVAFWLGAVDITEGYGTPFDQGITVSFARYVTV